MHSVPNLKELALDNCKPKYMQIFKGHKQQQKSAL